MHEKDLPAGDVDIARTLGGKLTYRSPEIVELGKATELLQGGSRVGGDGSSQTYGG